MTPRRSQARRAVEQMRGLSILLQKHIHCANTHIITRSNTERYNLVVSIQLVSLCPCEDTLLNIYSYNNFINN